MQVSGTAITKLERFAWFGVAAVLGGVWLFFEMIAGYEIPARAHPILGTLVATALVFGGMDLSKVRKARSLLAGDFSGAALHDLDGRLAALERDDPELLAAIRRTAARALARESQNHE